ncbi:MAG: helix-turn-helix transcriptional regulator [Clostridiales bacterium]|nr:helix-turn-helix transcriptional regulator [Clostridiales bacterium]
MELSQAVSARLSELMEERNMTQYKLFMRSGVPKSTISSIINCKHYSVQLRILHELCQGLDISIIDFFASPLFDESNLEP